MNRNDRPLQLITQLNLARDFLIQKTENQPLYGDLIETLDAIRDRLQTDRQPIVKFVSPDISLAAGLKAKHQENDKLRSLYKFESVAPIGQILQILQDCDLICLVYAKKHELRDHHYKLIELAQKQNIELSILVERSCSDADDPDCDRWQQDLESLTKDLPLSSSDYFIDLDRPETLDLYQQTLIDLTDRVNSSRQSRIANGIVRSLKSFFNQEITSLWQAIGQINTKYFAGQPLHLYQQQLRQDDRVLNQFRQQQIREIKQAINHVKTDWLNPFAIDGLIFNFQQAIDTAEVKIVADGKDTYLYLILAQFPQQPFFHDYIVELCQQRVNEISSEQWSNINLTYGAGGLKQLAERSNRELKKVESLLDGELKLICASQNSQPSLNISQVIDPYCLELNSRIPFDYSLTQSSWFRLFISTLVGMAIYLSTWLYLGTGKYIGFMIIIFQLINLITGQSIKKAKLKQQTKELKRIADQKCQSLVRTAVSYLAQTIIMALDRECQIYQQDYERAIAAAQSKLDELKQTNEGYKADIERLKSDRDKLIAWFD